MAGGDRCSRRARLDRVLVERGLAPTRSRAQALVLAGRVRSAGRPLEKPGLQVDPALPIEIDPGRRFVSRGGEKLAGALPLLGFDPTGLDALDVGASTGGFTQALLQAGAARVIALDVGRGQLEWGLRNDPRVHPLEGVNARYLRADQLPYPPELAVVDVSFISLTKVLPPVMESLVGRAAALALLKPQFEVGRGRVGRGGIVRNPELHRQVLLELTRFVAQAGWSLEGVVRSPIAGAEGNIEFFLHLGRHGAGLNAPALERIIEEVIGVPIP